MYLKIFMLFMIGHLIGDYYLQTQKMSIKKEFSFILLVIHNILYTGALILSILPVYSFDILVFALLLSASHFMIDLIKFLVVLDEKHDSKMFFIDQILHLICIVSSVLVMKELKIPVEIYVFMTPYKSVIDTLLPLILLILFIMKPVSVIIRQSINNYIPTQLKKQEQGNLNTGSLIGVLERLLILILLFLNQYTVIGLVFIGKSIARYDKIKKDPEFSEYYLVGSLMSILIVVLSYLTYQLVGKI